MDNSNTSSEEPLLLNDSIISSFKTCSLIKMHESPLNNISVSNDGNLYLTSGNDNQIFIYSLPKNEIQRHLVNKKFGCDKAIFTHNTKAILCASNLIIE